MLYFSPYGCHIIEMQQEEFKRVVLPLRGRLMAVAQRILSDTAEAEDAVQETLIRMWDMRGSLAEIKNITGLSVSITKNNCLNRLKFNKLRGRNAYAKIEAYDIETPHQRLERQDALDRTMTIIGTLPELQQAILKMKHIDGLEVMEIAELTTSTPEAVRMNLSRARRRVKELFMKGEK